MNNDRFPKEESTHRNLGNIYIKLGEKELGQAYLDKSNEIVKKNNAIIEEQN